MARRERASLYCARVALDTPAAGRSTSSLGAQVCENARYLPQRGNHPGAPSRKLHCDVPGGSAYLTIYTSVRTSSPRGLGCTTLAACPSVWRALCAVDDDRPSSGCHYPPQVDLAICPLQSLVSAGLRSWMVRGPHAPGGALRLLGTRTRYRFDLTIGRTCRVESPRALNCLVVTLSLHAVRLGLYIRDAMARGQRRAVIHWAPNNRSRGP